VIYVGLVVFGVAETVQTARDFCIYPRPTPVSSPTSGFLSSLVTELTGCGSVLTPWSVVVRPGQTIRLTLYDFAVARQRGAAGAVSSTSVHGDGGSPPTQSCPAYAVLREPTSRSKSSRTGRNVTVCGGVARRSVVYVSVGNKIDIGLERADHVVYGAHYLIEYQGSHVMYSLISLSSSSSSSSIGVGDEGRLGEGGTCPLQIFSGNCHVKFGHFRANVVKIRVF